MPIIDDDAIHRKSQAEWDRLRSLGITDEDVSAYFGKLPFEDFGGISEEEALRELLAGRDHLTEDDRQFIKRILDECR